MQDNAAMTWKDRGLILLKKGVNGFFFYAGWLICMQQAPSAHPWIGPLCVLAIILGHLYFNPRFRTVDLLLVGTLAFMGLLVDTTYITMGMIRYEGGFEAYPQIAPLWIISLWSLYAISINHSLTWLEIHKLLACSLGAMGAISSYLVGIKLGAAVFLWPEYAALATIGLVWSCVVPFSFWLSRFFQRLEKIT